MTPSFSFSNIRDNHTHGKMADFLKDRIQSGSKLSIVSAYFTIYAYKSLAYQFNQIKNLRFFRRTSLYQFTRIPVKRIVNISKLGSSRVVVELGRTDQDPLLKVDKITKPIAHAFDCFNGVFNSFNDAGRDSMNKVIQYITNGACLIQRLNSAMDNGAKPCSMGWRPCH